MFIHNHGAQEVRETKELMHKHAEKYSTQSLILTKKTHNYSEEIVLKRTLVIHKFVERIADYMETAFQRFRSEFVQSSDIAKKDIISVI